MTARRPMVLRDGDASYESLDAAPGLELGRVLTSAATTGLGGGFARFRTDDALEGWTLPYDEVFYVLSGELTLHWQDERLVARPGEVLLIPRGATVTYEGVAGTKAFFVLHPRDWASRAGDPGAEEITGPGENGTSRLEGEGPSKIGG